MTRAQTGHTAPFVTFEGIEGSGKTTQIRRLSSHLAAKGVLHLVTREPGGTPLSDEIRALVLVPREETVFPEAELLLYEAARAQHVRGLILPALLSGRAVLCDRFCDATTAYQAHARGLDVAQGREEHRHVAERIHDEEEQDRGRAERHAATLPAAAPRVQRERVSARHCMGQTLCL